MSAPKQKIVVRRTKGGEVVRTETPLAEPKTLTKVKPKEHSPVVHVGAFVKSSGTIVSDYWYDNLHNEQVKLDRQRGDKKKANQKDWTTPPPKHSGVTYRPKKVSNKPTTSDKYTNFKHLSAHEREGHDFSIEHKRHNDNVAVLAVHGGNTEPGTTEVAKAIAGKEYNYYSMVSHKPLDNGDLHITSTSFDEPRAVKLVQNSLNVLSIHGSKDVDKTVYLGGLDKEGKARLQKHLESHGFDVKEHDNPALSGGGSTNIVNRGLLGEGVQLELSRGLREQLFHDGLTTRAEPTQKFHDLVHAIRTDLKSKPQHVPKHIKAPNKIER